MLGDMRAQLMLVRDHLFGMQSVERAGEKQHDTRQQQQDQWQRGAQAAQYAIPVVP